MSLLHPDKATQSAIDQLTADDRELLRLFNARTLQREIAKKWGVSQSAICHRIIVLKKRVEYWRRIQDYPYNLSELTERVPAYAIYVDTYYRSGSQSKGAQAHQMGQGTFRGMIESAKKRLRTLSMNGDYIAGNYVELIEYIFNQSFKINHGIKKNDPA